MGHPLFFALHKKKNITYYQINIEDQTLHLKLMAYEEN